MTWFTTCRITFTLVTCLYEMLFFPQVKKTLVRKYILCYFSHQSIREAANAEGIVMALIILVSYSHHVSFKLEPGNSCIVHISNKHGFAIMYYVGK